MFLSSDSATMFWFSISATPKTEDGIKIVKPTKMAKTLSKSTLKCYEFV